MIPAFVAASQICPRNHLVHANCSFTTDFIKCGEETLPKRIYLPIFAATLESESSHTVATVQNKTQYNEYEETTYFSFGSCHWLDESERSDS
jgi:hypothetical protein